MFKKTTVFVNNYDKGEIIVFIALNMFVKRFRYDNEIILPFCEHMVIYWEVVSQLCSKRVSMERRWIYMLYGYCRCSTSEKRQDIKRQERELVKLGVEKDKIFWEYESGTKRNRAELNRLLDVVHTGDAIIATELSRITRSTKDLIEILELAQDKGLKLVLGSFEADCSKDKLDPMTEGMLKMMGVFAELERNMISERVKSGMRNAQAKGKVVGRPHTTINNLPQKFVEHYKLYKSGKLNKSELARVCELSRNSVNKYINIMEDRA